MSKRQHATADYESDGGFVADAPKSKKQKQNKDVNTGAQRDDEGNDYWEVRMRPSSIPARPVR